MGFTSTCTRAVELILERDKSQVNEMHHGKSTPLHIAANNDHDECIRVLVLQVSYQTSTSLPLLTCFDTVLS